jgi:hypothetical protein
MAAAYWTITCQSMAIIRRNNEQLIMRTHKSELGSTRICRERHRTTNTHTSMYIHVELNTRKALRHVSC